MSSHNVNKDFYSAGLKDPYRSYFCLLFYNQDCFRVPASRWLVWSTEKRQVRSSQKNMCHFRGVQKEEHAVAKQPACVPRREMLTVSGTRASGLAQYNSDVALPPPFSSSSFSFHTKGSCKQMVTVGIENRNLRDRETMGTARQVQVAYRGNNQQFILLIIQQRGF